MTVYNFSAGPAMLPASVLAQVQEELCDWSDGMSVMEISHRSEAFKRVAMQSEADLRELLTIPDNYTVLFLQGGATSQFSMLPLNLLRDKDHADYFYTGLWSEKAISEAKRYTRVHIVSSTEDEQFATLHPHSSWALSDAAAYVHYTANETIGGVEFHTIPETGAVPLVADMSSNLLSRPIDIARFGLIYASAQKNLGPAGITVVIIRNDLLGHATATTPLLMNYANLAKSQSMLNTPPTFVWYVMGLVFQWVKEQGGLTAMALRNEGKAKRLYDAIDNSNGFYRNPVAKHARSWMNVPFTLPDESLNSVFLAQARDHGLMNLSGHRSVGGMRASIYNAMPVAGVECLVDFMQDFAQCHA